MKIIGQGTGWYISTYIIYAGYIARISYCVRAVRQSVVMGVFYLFLHYLKGGGGLKL